MAPLDRERVPAYSLVARATDGGGRFCQSDLRLTLEDVNDNPPVFSSDHYNACVYENTATKALLTRVQAVDPDVGKSAAPMGGLPVCAFHTFRCCLSSSSISQPGFLFPVRTSTVNHISALWLMYFTHVKEICKKSSYLFVGFREAIL